MTATSPIDLTMASPQPSPLFSSSGSTASSASSASSSPSINPHSLMDDATHTPQTLKLVGISLSQHLIDFVVDQVIDTVDHAMNRPSTLLPASSSSKATQFPSSRQRSPVQQKFSSFATTVITRAEIITPTLLLALVYIHRARPYLHIALEEWALERVFLGALIVASKYANDSTLKNVHWALCTGVFGKRDVGRIEREFLAVLEWDLGVTENDILSLWEGLEWAVELKEQEEREKELAKLEREKQKLQLELAQRQQAVNASSSKFFLYSGDKSRQSSEDSLDIPPPLPVKSRNHKRSSVSVTSSSSHASAAPLPARQHSPSSSSVSSRSSSSSSSSSGDSPSPATPEDLHSRYVVINEDGSPTSASPSASDVPPPLPPKKRGLTATTMDLLRSFPFPGQQKEYHHHPYSRTSPQSKHGRYATTDGCAPASVRSTASTKRYR
ncbi:hypothetical protein BKA70DRAFT_1319009, partial [Coprinopsis sp. MPI-PUGE-AT-0042]